MMLGGRGSKSLVASGKWAACDSLNRRQIGGVPHPRRPGFVIGNVTLIAPLSCPSSMPPLLSRQTISVCLEMSGFWTQAGTDSRFT